MFKDLDEATVEGWVKWDRVVQYSKFFAFGGPYETLFPAGGARPADLVFHVASREPENVTYGVQLPGFLQTHRWFHLAAVSGSGGMKLACLAKLLNVQFDYDSERGPSEAAVTEPGRIEEGNLDAVAELLEKVRPV